MLIHGAFSAIGTSFAETLPGLSATRRVIAVEFQGHGHTADTDRPMTMDAIAEDVIALLQHLGVDRADVFGYSTGAAIGLLMAISHPETVRRLIYLSGTHQLSGIQPGLMDNLGEMSWEMMVGSPWYDEYQRIAPRPDDFPRLFAKKTEMDDTVEDIPDETFSAIASPILIALGDADLPTAEHAVKMFRLRGGGGFGDTPAGRPSTSQLLIIPGASHVTAPGRADILVPAITDFLDA